VSPFERHREQTFATFERVASSKSLKFAKTRLPTKQTHCDDRVYDGGLQSDAELIELNQSSIKDPNQICQSLRNRIGHVGDRLITFWKETFWCCCVNETSSRVARFVHRRHIRDRKKWTIADSSQSLSST